jgi:polyribonucleotide nucleotidyltransferase
VLEERNYMKAQSFTKEIAGKTITVEVGLLAPQANGACTVRIGDTVVLGTAVMSKSQRPGIDFLPLMVDYEERLYASGKIKGSRFVKREGRPTDEAVLTSRLIDRGIRPLFSKHVRNDIQVVATVLSYDSENSADVACMLAASIALSISDIPFEGPVSGVRVGRVDGKWIINPLKSELLKSDVDLVVSGRDDKVMMIEAGAKETNEADMFTAVSAAMEQVKLLNAFQVEIAKAVGVAKREIKPAADLAELKDVIAGIVGDRLEKAIDILAKEERNAEIAKINDEVIEKIKQDAVTAAEAKKVSVSSVAEFAVAQEEAKQMIDFRVSQAKEAFTKLWDKTLRMHILDKRTRLGGRKIDEVRPLLVKVGLFPRTHGSAFFQRGETQAVTLTTLGSPSMEQILDGMEEEEKKRYMHHYNFPAYATGETKPIRSPGRREIGHGALAERALEAVLPDKEKFAYAMRLVSEIFASNGSSSMAATCGSSLSLMDAGVPITKAVAGIAMGLMTDPDKTYERFEVLTDLQDAEDFAGDMDFKIAGTKDGITAIQMDTKIQGLSLEMVEKTFAQALTGRLHILDAMNAAIAEPRKDMSKFAPRLESFKIETDKIRVVIGKGGEMINKIIDECGVEIDIDDDGTVTVSSIEPVAMEKAVKWIKLLVTDPKPGDKFQGKITRLMDFGAFAEIVPGKEGLIHISQLSEEHIAHPGDVVKEGDVIPVVVTEIDELGRLNLSHLLAIGKKPRPGSERPPRRGGFGGPRRGGDRGGFGGRGGRPGGGGGFRDRGPRY